MTDLTPNQIKQTIKTEVTNLGFLLNGVTTPAQLESFPSYTQWIKAGYHAEMHYLAHPAAMEKRQDPSLIMSEVKSILVLGIPYPAPDQTKGLNIAAYARGTDYHDLIPQRLSGFHSWLEKTVRKPVLMRTFTDTAPILEKALAVRAGVGWIGKNSLVINPTYGSFFFLTEVFLDLELPPDEPFTQDLCGECSNCIDLCPTSAILTNRTINSKRCLSYLTIEKKGAFTEKQAKSIKESLFGCDQCQLVCPWNQKRYEDPSIPTLFQTDPNLLNLTREKLLAMTEEDFLNFFRHTPIWRTKRFGLLRNLLALLANTGAAEDLSSLDDFINKEENETLRMMASNAQVNISKRLNIN
mgnify:CR=1 FL=1